MTRSLTAGATTSKNAATGTPINILKLELGGAVGTVYCSDRGLGTGDGSTWDNAQGRVVDWGSIAALLSESGGHAVGDAFVELQDADKMFKGYLDTVEWQGKPATVYQLFDGLGA